MIKTLLTSAAATALGLGLFGCAGETEVGVGYTEGPAPAVYEPYPAYYTEGGVIYARDFDDYWHHHHDWDRDRAWRHYNSEVREHHARIRERREERREHRHY